MNVLDILVGLGYTAALLMIAAATLRRNASRDELALAGRSLPTWAVLCSMIATELSAATFVGVPHAAYTGDWSYLQLAIGALLAKAVLARWVIPLYHALGITTVYGFLLLRFGPDIRRAAALCFVLGRILASGVRLFIAALALSVATGSSVSAAIIASGLLAGVYTSVGGIRAVVWTDTLQGVVFLGAALCTLGFLLFATHGGAGELLTWAEAAGRTRVLHPAPLFALGDSQALGTALFGAFALTLATHATDHDMVQRLLTTRDGRGGGRALLGSALLNFPLTLLFLAIGTALAFFYREAPAYDIADHARILPLFAVHELPAGLRGLVFAGLFAAAMSSLDSAICAIATTWEADVRGNASARDDSAAPLRRATAVTTVILIGAALAMAGYHRLWSEAGSAAAPGRSLVDFALSSMTILYGGLLGIFGLGLTTRSRGSERSTSIGLGVGASAGLLLFLQPVILGTTPIAWPWWIPISAGLTAGIAALAPSASGGPEATGLES